MVSLTTYGARAQKVFLAIESIGCGQVLPSRLVLWIDHALLAKGLPIELERLVARGLEVKGTEDVYSHKKYFPQVMSDPAPSRLLVTADDDVIYPRHWLAGLVEGSSLLPSAISCFRAHRMHLAPDGTVAPYREWHRCNSVLPHALNFLTGSSGVAYPVSMQMALRDAGDAFLACCPKADDIWLNVIALRTGIPVRQITPHPRRFLELPGSQAQGLARSNVGGGANDRQIAATYTAADLALLRTRMQRY